jgi:hypothetical protein
MHLKPVIFLVQTTIRHICQYTNLTIGVTSGEKLMFTTRSYCGNAVYCPEIIHCYASGFRRNRDSHPHHQSEMGVCYQDLDLARLYLYQEDHRDRI